MKKTILSIFSIFIFGFLLPLAHAKPSDPLPPDLVTSTRRQVWLLTGDFLKEILPAAIKILLAVTGTIAFGVFVYTGLMLIISQGDEEQITKFKSIFLYSVIGLLFIAASYALVTGIFQFATQ